MTEQSSTLPLAQRHGLDYTTSQRCAFSPKRGCSSVVEHNLAKVGVVGSNPITRSRFSKILSILFIRLRHFLLQILSCVFAVIIVLWRIGYALEMQFMELRGKKLTHSQRDDGKISVWIHHFAPTKNLNFGCAISSWPVCCNFRQMKL